MTVGSPRLFAVAQQQRTSDDHFTPQWVVCCRDFNLTLCAHDATDMEYVPNTPASCVVCVDLDDPDGDDCPFGGRCPE